MFERLVRWFSGLGEQDGSSTELDELKLNFMISEYRKDLNILEKNPKAFSRKTVKRWDEHLSIAIEQMKRLGRPKEWIDQLKVLKSKFDDFLNKTE